MKKISLKTRWISTSAWRGYEEPVHAVCGADDTGNWSDSPCPSKVRAEELKRAKAILSANGIEFKQKTCQSSNVFCAHVYLVTAEEDMARAIELLMPLESDTRLLYVCNKNILIPAL
jgi:hypothetical protein